MAADSSGRPPSACSGLCSRCRGHVCQKCTDRGAPLLGEGARASRLFQREGEGCLCLEAVLANRLFYFFFCHHTFYFCASVVCTAAFVSLFLPRFFRFIFNFLLLLCSLGILLHCLILYLGGICQRIIKWKCSNSPGLPFVVRRNDAGEELLSGLLLI